MKVIYENKVKASGIAVEEFKDAGMFIIFGENAPEEIRDYCYSVSVNPINGELAAGQYLVIDGQEYKITCVGYEAPITLKGLGHCTFNSRHDLLRGEAHAGDRDRLSDQDHRKVIAV